MYKSTTTGRCIPRMIKNINASQFPEKHRRFNSSRRPKSELIPPKPRLKPPPKISLELRQADSDALPLTVAGP